MARKQDLLVDDCGGLESYIELYRIISSYIVGYNMLWIYGCSLSMNGESRLSNQYSLNDSLRVTRPTITWYLVIKHGHGGL